MYNHLLEFVLLQFIVWKLHLCIDHLAQGGSSVFEFNYSQNFFILKSHLNKEIFRSSYVCELYIFMSFDMKMCTVITVLSWPHYSRRAGRTATENTQVIFSNNHNIVRGCCETTPTQKELEKAKDQEW